MSASSWRDALRRASRAVHRKPLARRGRAAYCSAIDTATPTAKDATMNTSTILHRAVSFSFAVLVTVMTLAGVDSLAKQEPSAAQMARAAAISQA
jgi:glyceraldehyde-3-phosphate dehydrogenase/erythrose-4-phosphate dehydrogenase